MDRISEIRENLAEMQRLSPMGFAVALHVSFTTPRFLFQTYARDWMRHYSEKGLVLDDPTVKWGLEHDGVVDWADLAKDDARGVLAQAQEYGLRHGVTVSVYEEGSRSVGSFAREDRAFSAEEQDTLKELFGQLHRATRVGPDEEPSLTTLLKSLSVDMTHPGRSA